MSRGPETLRDRLSAPSSALSGDLTPRVPRAGSRGRVYRSVYPPPPTRTACAP